MCSDSLISQVALLQVHCAGKGDISGHVCVDQIYICSLCPSPRPPPRWNFTTFASLCGNTRGAGARPLMAGAQVCGATLLGSRFGEECAVNNASMELSCVGAK